MVKKYSKKDSCSSSVFPFFVIIIGSILRGDGNEFWKTKRGFCPQQTHSQNFSQFCNNYYHLRDSNSSLWPIFQGLKNLIIYCFSHKFSTCFLINSRIIFKNQERFLFFMDSFKKNSLSFHIALMDREIWRRLWDPIFQKLTKLPQDLICYFWLISL